MWPRAGRFCANWASLVRWPCINISRFVTPFTRALGERGCCSRCPLSFPSPLSSSPLELTNIQHEPELRAANTALAIYRTTDAATRCLSASPVRFTLDLTPPPSSSSSSPYTALTLLHPPTTRRASSSSPHTNNPPTTTPPRTFSLHITPSTTNHSAYISRQHYTGRFTLNKRTVMAVDLADRVPLKGLADCRMTVGEVPLRLRKVRAEEERVEGRGVWKVGPGEVWRGLVERREREKSMGKGLDGGGDGVGADEALRTP